MNRAQMSLPFLYGKSPESILLGETPPVASGIGGQDAVMTVYKWGTPRNAVALTIASLSSPIVSEKLPPGGQLISTP